MTRFTIADSAEAAARVAAHLPEFLDESFNEASERLARYPFPCFYRYRIYRLDHVGGAWIVRAHSGDAAPNAGRPADTAVV